VSKPEICGIRMCHIFREKCENAKTRFSFDKCSKMGVPPNCLSGHGFRNPWEYRRPFSGSKAGQLKLWVRTY